MTPPQKLYTRFLRQLVPLLALAFLLAATVTAGLHYQGQRTEADKQRSQTLETLSRVLIKPLWDCNSLTAHGILHAMTLQPDVRGVSALDQCAQKRIQAGELPKPGDKDTLSTPLSYIDETGRAHALGELHIAFAPISVFTAAAQGLMPQLAVFLSMLAAVLAGALWIFNRTIGQPLLQLRQAMRKHQTLEPIPVHWTEELTEVTQTYNTQLQELRRQARRDPLTGLGNRLLLEEHLDRAIRHTKRTGLPGHVLLLDLNRFKPINDTFGHAAGDEVLRTVARRLLACVRDVDTVARLGGDEFVIILTPYSPPPDAQDAAALATRIKHALTQPIVWQGTPIHITISIGLAQFHRGNETPAALLAQADTDMYSEKPGRNRR
ncbi:MAG: GGDEF domain-containing protein [Castellaniella sp.]|uniref:GGDEF domain-containing protein n=1 Tax=Castellaniella sp. TaxID=1955812 RepID=UPI003C713C29